MNNPFKKILHNKELPSTIKEKVIADVNLIKLSLDLTELFVVNVPDVVSRFFESPETSENIHIDSENKDIEKK